MKKHQYRITVEHLEGPNGESLHDAPLTFLAGNHDDILALADRTGAHDDKDRAFLIGLKLLGEALLDDRENPLYSDFTPHFRDFMKRIKQDRANRD